MKTYIIRVQKEYEDKLAEAYNHYMELKEKLEKDTGFYVVKNFNNYKNCIVRINKGSYVIGTVLNDFIGLDKNVWSYPEIEELIKG